MGASDSARTLCCSHAVGSHRATAGAHCRRTRCGYRLPVQQHREQLTTDPSPLDLHRLEARASAIASKPRFTQRTIHRHRAATVALGIDRLARAAEDAQWIHRHQAAENPGEHEGRSHNPIRWCQRIHDSTYGVFAPER
jgi:hypothetical protein